MPANAAIYFEPEGYSMSGPRLMGRNAAGHSFLNGFFRHADVDCHAAFVTGADKFEVFRAMAQEARCTAPLMSIQAENFHDLAKIGCLYIPGPGLMPQAAQRALIDPRAFSLCGITHTTLSARAMDGITSLLTAHVEPWDAVICTSRAVRDTVQSLLEAEAERLTARLGATRFPLPRLPVIPLGIDTASFAIPPQARAEARQALAIDDDTVVVLFLGRLSFHAKAHPAALYEALARASGSQRVILIECGWFANSFIESAFAETAAEFAPALKRIVLDGRDPMARQQAWAAADIFSSLTDNLQETFGITPLEAMASGLPVIVTDWNGYRDTVRHGIDGFRIKTFAPPPGSGPELAYRHAVEADNYDHYCALTSLLVSVDISEAIQAFKALIHNPDLRRLMGAEGQAHARNFDWSHIIPRYQALWADLAEERRSATSLPTVKNQGAAWPARLEPFTAFASYPSQHLTADFRIIKNTALAASAIEGRRKTASLTLGAIKLAPDPDFSAILNLMIDDEPLTIAALADKAKKSPQAMIPFIAYALKIGAVLPAPDGGESR